MEISVSQKNKNSYMIELVGQCWERNDLVELKESIENLLGKGVNKIILNLSRMSFISSQGLGLLVGHFSNVKNKGGELILYKPQGCVKETIELSGFNLFMNIIESTDELNTYIL